ncbi:MAG: ribosomal protein S18-alanine N-acetyltransferase, partial [Bdellovibrionales bacterium]|nr:ribosomal protein S18-alanine N-acetyltransferase [Bdellovibrionales bacterium]
ERAVHLSPWDESHFSAELEKSYSRILVMTDDETDSVIAGYVVFWLMFDEAQILNIAVDLPFRGLGLARSLIRQVVSHALKKNIQKVLLDVRKSNQAAIELYQSMKFSIAQARKGFYPDGEDAYTMVLWLSEEGLSSEEKGF